MKPKQKALELVEETWKHFPFEYIKNNLNCPKEVAIIFINEIIKEASDIRTTYRYKGCIMSDLEYWQEVKKEIIKI